MVLCDLAPASKTKQPTWELLDNLYNNITQIHTEIQLIKSTYAHTDLLLNQRQTNHICVLQPYMHNVMYFNAT